MQHSKKKLATTFFPALIGLVALLVAACGTGGTSTNQTTNQSGKAAADKQIYISPLANLDKFKTLDPAKVTDTASGYAIQMLYSGLVELDTKGNIIPMLAKSWAPSDGGKTWTFTLRDDAKFNDGTPITSTDVAFSINRALDPATKSPFAIGYMGLIADSDKFQDPKSGIKTLIGDSILAPDAHTVVIKLSKPAAYFLQSFAFQTSYVVEKAAVDKYGEDFTKFENLSKMGGSGNWVLSEYTIGKQVAFTPNQYFFGKKPQLAKVVRPFYKDSATAWKAYQANQVDSSGVPSASIEQAKALPQQQYHWTPDLAIWFFQFNYLVKPFNNIKFRQAMSLAIDRDLIAQNIYKGRVTPSYHIVPKGMPGYSENLTGPAGVTSTKGDAAKAKELLNEALKEMGYSDVSQLGQIVIENQPGGTDLNNELAAEQQMWKTVLGVDVKFNPVSFDKFLEDTNGTIGNDKLAAWYGGWGADYPDPQDFITLQFAKGAANNQDNYGVTPEQQQLQEQMLQADVNQDPTARMKQYNDIEQSLVNDVAWMSLYQSGVSGVRKPCVTGIIDSPFFMVPDDWASVYINANTTCADGSQYK